MTGRANARPMTGSAPPDDRLRAEPGISRFTSARFRVRAIARPQRCKCTSGNAQSRPAPYFTFTSVAKPACDQVAPGFAGFLGLRRLALTGFCELAGLMLSGLPAAAGVAADSDSLKNARHPGVSWDLFLIMQAVMRSTSGMSALQSRNASALQACCCSSV